jgi:antitoxin ParD1/3/4
MGNVSKISVALTTELAATVHEAVKSGEFASASEVIRDALRNWNQRRAERAAAIGETRRAWYEGINSGAPVDGEVFFAELETELDTLVAATEDRKETAAQ